MDDKSIELLTLALIREYLSRKGFKSTLHTFDKESGKKNESITNRRLLAEELKIFDLVRSNKVLGNKRFQSFIEMMVLYFVNGRKITPDLQNERSGNLNIICSTSFENESNSYRFKDGKDFLKDKRVASSRKRCTSKQSTLNDRKKNDSIENILENKSSNDMLNNLENKNNLDSSVSFIESLRKKKEAGKAESPKNDSLLIQNLEEDLSITAKENVHRSNNSMISRPTLYTEIKEITLELAIDLKNLVFSNAKMCFNHEWCRQGFYFSKNESLKYGLVQEKGGPCGLLASVQAWVLKVLLKEQANDLDVHSACSLSPSPEQQTSALIKALVEILWNVRGNDKCVVVFPSRCLKFNTTQGKYKNDKITERLDLYHFDMRENVEGFIKKNLKLFCGENGLVLFLYSVILSRGINNIRNDMDEPNKGTLIGCHGYCTQEMVNMLLIGKAVSNVFDGDKFLGDQDSPEQVVLYGIHSQSPIGFLSLFEHYNSCQVGNHFKSPKHPIWVVCSESHFSVLFTTGEVPSERSKRTFDLYYFDGLGQQDEEIRLSITPDGLLSMLDDDIDLIPPIDSCIRTKWKNALIDWNGTEPLL